MKEYVQNVDIYVLAEDEEQAQCDLDEILSALTQQRMIARVSENGAVDEL